MSQQKVKKQPVKPTGKSISSEPITQRETKADKAPHKWLLAGIIFIISFLLYSNTFNHRFVLDDPGIISSNRITTAPVSWENTRQIFSTPLRKGAMDRDNSLYRPLTKLSYNVEWNLFDGNPHPFHLINVILYGILGITIFLVLYEAFEKRWIIPFITTVLFAVHPIHSEAVANIKGREEILSLLSIMIALRGIQLYIRKDNILWLMFAVIAFFPGLFSKESTIIAVGIFPLFIYYFTNASVKKNISVSAVMLVPALVFLACRWMVLHDLKQMEVSEFDNMLLFSDNRLERFTTAIALLGVYLLKFIIPYPLSCDYSYPTFEPMGAGDPRFFVSFLVLSFLLFYAIRSLKKKDSIGFGIFWFFISIALVSNIFFLIGTSFGERLLFVPSLGLCVSTTVLLYTLLSKAKGGPAASIPAGHQRTLWLIMTPIFLLFSFKTYSRNKAWETDYTLFKTDIENYPDGIHLLYLLGNHLSEDYRKQSITAELTELGYNEQQIADSLQRDNYYSIYYLSKSLSIHPSLPPVGLNQLGKAYDNIHKYDSAYKYYVRAYNIDTANAVYSNNVGIVHFIEGRYDEALPYFKKAYRLDSTILFVNNNLGRLYGMRQMFDSALYWFQKTQALDSTDLTSLEFLELTWRNIGNNEKADYYKTRTTEEKEKKKILKR